MYLEVEHINYDKFYKKNVIDYLFKNKIEYTTKRIITDNYIDPNFILESIKYIKKLSGVQKIALYIYTIYFNNLVNSFLRNDKNINQIISNYLMFKNIDHKLLQTNNDINYLQLPSFIHANQKIKYNQSFGISKNEYDNLKKYITKYIQSYFSINYYDSPEIQEMDLINNKKKYSEHIIEIYKRMNSSFFDEINKLRKNEFIEQMRRYFHIARNLIPKDLSTKDPSIISILHSHNQKPTFDKFKSIIEYITIDGWKNVIRQYIFDMDEIFKNAPQLPYPIVVYRGEKKSKKKSISPSYVSTTMRRNIAERFSYENDNTIKIITVQENMHLLALFVLSEFTTEEEILIARDEVSL
jgi:hypothetical protein